MGNNYHDAIDNAHPVRDQIEGEPVMETENPIPAEEITPEEIEAYIARGRRMRSEFIATALRALVRRLRPARRAPATDRAVTC